MEALIWHQRKIMKTGNPLSVNTNDFRQFKKGFCYVEFIKKEEFV